MSLLIFLSITLVWLLYNLFRYNTYNPHNGFKTGVIAHSKGYTDNHLSVVTFHLRYPRFIHSEMMTHKDFSRSAASSRAIPVAKMLNQVWNEPAMPIHWGINQPGMQATKEFSPWKQNFLRNLWQLCGRTVCVFVWVAMKFGLHKQVANRMLEPWQWMQVTLTTCKLANFFNLRIHSDAQPEIRYLAEQMKDMLSRSTPRILQKNEWHLPWITDADRELVSHMSDPVEVLKKMSAARCARSSYANFDGERSVEKDLATYAKLVEAAPVHASPCEHQCTPDRMVYEPVRDTRETCKTTEEGVNRVGFVRQWANWQLHGNLTGYIQYRNTIPNHYKPD